MAELASASCPVIAMFIETILYTATATEGRATASDKVLDAQLSTSLELSDVEYPGTNPAQLFAADYSACLLDALKFGANNLKITQFRTSPLPARPESAKSPQASLLQPN